MVRPTPAIAPSIRATPVSAVASHQAEDARLLREEQELSYAESLSRDQARDREAEAQRVESDRQRREAELQAERDRIDREEAERQARLAEMERAHAEAARKARLSELTALYPPAPPAAARSRTPSPSAQAAAASVAANSTHPHSTPPAPPAAAATAPGDVTLIKLRCPDGVHAREFPLSAPLSDVCLFAEQRLLSAGYPLGSQPALTVGFPPAKIAESDYAKTLRELNLKGAIITVSAKNV